MYASVNLTAPYIFVFHRIYIISDNRGKTVFQSARKKYGCNIIGSYFLSSLGSNVTS